MNDEVSTNDESTKKADKARSRREFLKASYMWIGLGVGYAVGATHFLRYLVPLGDKIKYREMFVGPVDELEVGQSRIVTAPTGESYVMARIGEKPESASFRVLSDICPHLGCRVHWEPENNRFFCPCHDGVFDPAGKATGGPPADAGQNRGGLETRVRGNSVFVMIKEA